MTSHSLESFVLTVIASPVLYCGLLGGLLAMYVVWRLCRQSYLLPDKQFNVLWLGWLAGYAVVVMGGWLRLAVNRGDWLNPEQWLWGLLPLSNWEIWQSASLIGAAYAAAGAAAVWYIRSIRYPLWKMLDMAALGLMVWQVSLAIGWVIRWSSWPNTLDWLMVGWSVVWLVLMSWLYRRPAVKSREGIVAAAQVIGVFVWLMTSQLLELAWQGHFSIVELIVTGVGLLAGIGLLGYRLRQPSSVVRLQETPSGVSQSFRETFSRLSLSGNQSSPAETPRTQPHPEATEATATVGKAGVAVLNQEEFAPPINKPVKKLLKKRSSKAKSSSST